MRKFARIKTKLISCILLLAMSALFLASANHVQADQEYLSFDQYKAEHYINYSSYEYFMSDDFKMPYRTTVEKDRSSATFNSLLAAWEVATFSGSNVVEMANKRKGYYEAFLFDIIYTGTDAVNVTDAMNAGIKATQASVLSKVTKLMDEGYYKDIDVRKLTEESYAKLVSGLESCGEFNDIFSAVNNVGKYVQYANDIETLVYRMAKIEAICGQSKEYADVLRDMSKNTTDETLAAACDDMASICDGVMNAKLMDAIMTGEEVVTNVSKWVTDKIWDYVIDSLGACGIGVTAGQAVGTWASGLLFSTDKTIETYYEMSALYNFDNAIRKVVKKYERQYSRYSSDSVEYAKKFNASVELMLKTQELGCDISIKDAEYKYEKGIANVFVSRFNGKKEAMASYKKSLQGIKKNISFIYTFANGDLYNCYKDEYCSNVSDDLGMTDVATTDDGSSASKADEKQVTQELIRTAEACCKKEIKEPMKLTGNVTYYGDVYVSSDLNLNGYKCTVYGNLIQSNGTLTLNGGTLDVSGDYRMENENVDSTGNVSYSGGSAKLNMINANDCVNVGGTFEFDASDGDLTDGIICIKKDFIIKSYYWRFNPTGNHTIKLDGDKVQKIQIDNSSNNKINNLYLTKDKSTGYNFVTDNCWNKLYLKTKVDKVTVSSELKEVCQGEQIQYAAQVSGVNSPSQAVTWSVTGAKSADTHIDENGLLSVAKDEAASNIVIKAVSAEDSSKTASQTVNITKRVPRVDAVRLSANTASMCPGDTHKFSAAVLGENDISQEVVWSVTGQQSADTKVAKDGTLTVGKDEGADNISVVATSAVNNKVSASVKIQIVHIIIDSGVDQVAIVVKCGGSLSFEAHIVGINLSSDAVTWSVSNNTSKATSISQEGVLTVGEDEKAATLIVTAMSVADPTKSASVNVKVEGSDNAKVVGYSVGLSDMISLNMYTYVPEKFLSDAGANAVFTLADGTVTQQPLSEFKKASYNGVNTVVINTKMVPAYITRSVTMKIVGSDGKESEGFTYSIYEYAKDYIKYATTETEYQKALPLVKAMLDYGAYSQLFFGVDASNLANYDRVSNLKLTEGNVEQTSCDSVFNAIKNEETGTLGNEELIYQNISLICESETSMKLYFQNKNNLTLNQIKEKYAIKVYDSEGNVIPDDGCEMQVEGDLFWIKIKNLGPVKLSSDYTVEFTSEAGTQSGTVSPICYIKKAMKQDDMNLQNLCKAMYLYNKATLEYIGQ